MKEKTRRLTLLDWLILFLLVLGGLWLAGISADKPLHPAEDAAMLMRYSQHLSQGHGIVWNVGQPPVDGATDFLFMAVLAGIYALGGGLESSVFWLGAISHLVTVLLVYYGIRRFFKGGVLVALLSSLFLLVGPGLRYTEAGFGTPFFALFCGLTWLLAQYALENPKSTWRDLLFAVSGLLMGLTRPEGVLLAGFIMLAVLIKLGWWRSRRIFFIFAVIFLILGGIYFFWRWQYFGYPLPNPFYKKGGGQLYFGSLQESISGVLELSFPFWLAGFWGLICILWLFLKKLVLVQDWFWKIRLAVVNGFQSGNRKRIIESARIFGFILLIGFTIGLFRQSSALHESLLLGRYSGKYAGMLLAMLAVGVLGLTLSRWLPMMSSSNSLTSYSIEKADNKYLNKTATHTLFVGIPVVGFTVIWILLSNEMNYLWRFQYPILPVILMSWPLLLASFWKTLCLPEPAVWKVEARWVSLFTMVFIAGIIIWQQTGRWNINYQTDGRFEVAEYLSAYQARGYTMATTEAGLLPLYSGWQAVDTWGLNDTWIAHHGGLTEEYLASIRPELIMFHADFSPIMPRDTATDAWSEMTLILEIYARNQNYTLAAVYGPNPADTHYYYVRSGFPESDEIVSFLRSLDGGKYGFGTHTVDYNQLTWKTKNNAK